MAPPAQGAPAVADDNKNNTSLALALPGVGPGASAQVGTLVPVGVDPPTPPRAESPPNSRPDLKKSKQDPLGEQQILPSKQGSKFQTEDDEKQRLLAKILERSAEINEVLRDVVPLRERRTEQLSRLEDRMKEIEDRILHGSLLSEADERGRALQREQEEAQRMNPFQDPFTFKKAWIPQALVQKSPRRDQGYPKPKSYLEREMKGLGLLRVGGGGT